MTWTRHGPILALLAAAVLTLAAGEVCLSRGMRAATAGAAGEGWPATVGRAARSGWVWAGGALLAAHLGFYLAALGRADLSLVLTLTAAAYPLTILLAAAVLGEPVGPARWLGTALITAGVAVVGLAEPGAGTAPAGPPAASEAAIPRPPAR